MVEEITGHKQDQAMMSILGDNYKMYKDIKDLATMKGVQARMPFLIEIK
jgi:hypothetical protein